MSARRVGVVIPALNERELLGEAIASAWTAGADEVVVADGGSSDGSADLVLPPATLVRSDRGRARQIEAGRAACGAEILLVLHADSRLPEGACAAVRQAVAAGAVGGAFLKRFTGSRALLLRGAGARTRLWWALGLSFGDQAQFARADVVAALGGFRQGVPAEDLDFGVRLRRAGRCALLPLPVETSARRLASRGVVPTWVSWWRVAVSQLVATRWGTR